jgi:hypothetical protein
MSTKHGGDDRAQERMPAVLEGGLNTGLPTTLVAVM